MAFRDCTFEGRLSADAELKYLQNGTALAKLSIGVSEKRGDAWETNYFRVNLWANTAEKMVPKLKKGANVLVMCKPSMRTFKDSSGMSREVVEFDAYRLYLIAPRDVAQEHSHEDEGVSL